MASITPGNISKPAVIRRVLTTPATWAVVGLSTDVTRTAHGVARWMQEALGHRIIPVHPRAEEVWGEAGYPTLAQVPDNTVVTVVDFFVNSQRVGAVVDEAIVNKDRLGIEAPVAPARGDRPGGGPTRHQRRPGRRDGHLPDDSI